MTHKSDELELDRLYNQYAELMALPDALEPGSDTDLAIKRLDIQLTAHEQIEADELVAKFEARLLMPIGAGMEMVRKLDQLIERMT